jgi:hypothetical protein
MKTIFALTILLGVFACCRPKPLPPAHDAVWQKLKFSIADLGKDGVTKGGTSINYEFCIPDKPDCRAEVAVRDSTVMFQKGRGRVACSGSEVLCIGSTLGTDYKLRLYRLCQLPYIQKIEETFWE